MGGAPEGAIQTKSSDRRKASAGESGQTLCQSKNGNEAMTSSTEQCFLQITMAVRFVQWW